MRLHREVSAVLRTIHRELYGESGGQAPEREVEAHAAELPDLLTAVLVDPNLHSDLRRRLHREIHRISQPAPELAGTG